MPNYNQYTKPSYDDMLKDKAQQILKDAIPTYDVGKKILCQVSPIHKGYTHQGAYTRVNFNGGKQFTHRIVWMHANGSIKDKFDVSHLCHNGKCIKLSHLHVEDHQYNVSRQGCKGIIKNGRKWKRACKHEPFCKVITVESFEVIDEPSTEQ
jgi:hypothetical protein